MAHEHGTEHPRDRARTDVANEAAPPVDGAVDATGCTGSGTWKSFLRVHALVTRRIETDLMGAHRLSLVSFEVLERLAAAPDRRLRMAELAELLVVSRSGVTRAVDRLEREGLVTREACDSDLRGTFARITDRGLVRLAAAAPTHQAGVQFYLLDPLGADGADVLSEMLAPVLERAALP